MSFGIFTISILPDNRKGSITPQGMSSYLQTRSGLRVIVLGLIAFCFGTSQVVFGGLQSRKSSREKRVDELFNRNCARCHGADGRGATPQGQLFNAPDFTDREWWQKNSRITNPHVQRAIIIRGKATMPAFGKKLTRSDINLLLSRIRSFRPSERKS